MKKLYEPASLLILVFDNLDVITTSGSSDDEFGGSGIGGGYNPGGWT